MNEQNDILLTNQQLLDIQTRIYEIRGVRVMLDFDLAELYHVETRVLNQAVKRNLARFPEDFMFQLAEHEWVAISSQIVMTSRSKRPKTALPYAFTEHGLVMLASILHSEIAINTRTQSPLPNVSGVTLKNNGNIKDIYFFVTDNGNTIWPSYQPYMRKKSFWNLHYGLKK